MSQRLLRVFGATFLATVIALSSRLPAVACIGCEMGKSIPQLGRTARTSRRTVNYGLYMMAKGAEYRYMERIPTARPVAVRVTPTRLPSSPPSGNDFWRRLANCESPSGASGYHRGYFQFSPDTARKVGIDGSESYEEQKKAAQSWASQVDPGTSAGWPHCWHVALRGG